eukprot:ANDGO_03956.mRNA.1 hypothetical protein
MEDSQVLESSVRVVNHHLRSTLEIMTELFGSKTPLAKIPSFTPVHIPRTSSMHEPLDALKLPRGPLQTAGIGSAVKGSQTTLPTRHPRDDYGEVGISQPEVVTDVTILRKARIGPKSVDWCIDYMFTNFHAILLSSLSQFATASQKTAFEAARKETELEKQVDRLTNQVSEAKVFLARRDEELRTLEVAMARRAKEWEEERARLVLEVERIRNAKGISASPAETAQSAARQKEREKENKALKEKVEVFEKQAKEMRALLDEFEKERADRQILLSMRSAVSTQTEHAVPNGNSVGIQVNDERIAELQAKVTRLGEQLAAAAELASLSKMEKELEDAQGSDKKVALQVSKLPAVVERLEARARAVMEKCRKWRLEMQAVERRKNEDILRAVGFVREAPATDASRSPSSPRLDLSALFRTNAREMFPPKS